MYQFSLNEEEGVLAALKSGRSIFIIRLMWTIRAGKCECLFYHFLLLVRYEQLFLKWAVYLFCGCGNSHYMEEGKVEWKQLSFGISFRNWVCLDPVCCQKPKTWTCKPNRAWSALGATHSDSYVSLRDLCQLQVFQWSLHVRFILSLNSFTVLSASAFALWCPLAMRSIWIFFSSALDYIASPFRLATFSKMMVCGIQNQTGLVLSRLW